MVHHYQGRSDHRINDTGYPSYRGPNICNYSPNLTGCGRGSLVVKKSKDVMSRDLDGQAMYWTSSFHPSSGELLYLPNFNMIVPHLRCTWVAV
ncbi:hypothetical protein TNCV_2108171 [Trichonephila clavipes]|nr:hypothetical protein TNCV_2108171 [Trichonephila clavipes]